jgi:hypothetical protein
MPNPTGEVLPATSSLSELAINAHRKAQEELAGHRARLARVLGERPIGPTTIGEREQEAARAESIGTLGYEVTEWIRGSLPSARGYAWPCWYAEIPGNDNALLLYFASRLGLCCLIECRNHQHLRRLSSLAEFGEMLMWTPGACLRERLSGDRDKRTIEVKIA